MSKNTNQKMQMPYQKLQKVFISRDQSERSINHVWVKGGKYLYIIIDYQFMQ